jgi:hypothetical protein
MFKIYFFKFSKLILSKSKINKTFAYIKLYGYVSPELHTKAMFKSFNVPVCLINIKIKESTTETKSPVKANVSSICTALIMPEKNKKIRKDCNMSLIN